MIYDLSGIELNQAYGINGNALPKAYDIDQNEVFPESDYMTDQLYKGGYVEIQPDSWDGVTPVTGDYVSTSDSTAWGFPQSLSSESFASIKNEIMSANGYGIMYIRMPMGFAYRGYRNIDATTGLAKNIGERWSGQNALLKQWFSDISDAGGGLAPEYWCLAPYWVTGGAYYNPNGLNTLRAGGDYPQTQTLKSIKGSDASQYEAQIDAISDAIIDDLEYLHINVAPVRMFNLHSEPWQQKSQKFGSCYIPQDVYVDLMGSITEKIHNSPVLSTYNSKPNEVLIYDQDGYCGDANYLWGHAIDHHFTTAISGENGGNGAEWYKTATLKENSFLNEYEYWGDARTDEFRCANSMLRMINELVYGRAQVVQPIIHICKPKGQTDANTNTRGYCIYAVNMANGSYEPNTWAYNAWKMINDNLPIGSLRVTNYSVNIANVGLLSTVKNKVLRLFLANNSDIEKVVDINFGMTKTFSRKLYNLTNLGTTQSDLSGSSISIVIPAYSGIVLTEIN